VNVLEDPNGLAELQKLGLKTVPVLSRGDKFVLGQNPPLIAHQEEKGVKDLRRGRQRLSIAPQDAFPGVQRKWPEFV